MRDRFTPVAAVVTAAAAGGLVVFSLQLAVGLVLLVSVVALYLHSPRAGVVAVWLLWLTIPLLRRVFGLIEEVQEYDILSLVPFAATGLVAVLEAERLYLTPRAKALIGLAAIGFAVGIPAGLLDPTAGFFAMGAYLSALAAFALGYAERRRGAGEPALATALLFALPLIAIYGIFQYFFPLTAWDENWLRSVSFGSIGAPEEGHIRIFATLNSPTTFATMLVFGILTVISTDKARALRPLLVALFMFALALTFVRSAWLAFLPALVVYAAASGVRRPARAVAIVGLLVAIGIVTSGSNSTAAAFVDRLTTLRGLEGDRSATVRSKTANELAPQIIEQPFGEGLGRAGIATKLGGGDGKGVIDNGYLALGVQVGLLGSLLILAAGAWAVSLAARAARLTRGLPAPCLCLSILVVGAVMHLSGDVLYGVVGAVFWYVAGFATATTDEQEAHLRPATASLRPWPYGVGRMRRDEPALTN